MDTTELLLSDPVNRDLVGLLAACSADSSEKLLWITLIPVMTDAEKTELKKNLEAQIEEDIKYDELVLKKFLQAMSHV